MHPETRHKPFRTRRGGYPEKIMMALNYTTQEINRNFIIKVNGMVDEVKVNIAVGVRGLRRIVNNDDLCNRLLDRAFDSMNDKVVCKLRRGIKISFYYK